MRRVELNAFLSEEVWDALSLLLDLPPDLLQAAWWELGRPNRGYRRYQSAPDLQGRRREIHIPPELVKKTQRRILERVLYSGPTSSSAYAGVPKRSYAQAAQLHLAQPGHILQLDIKNAFPSTRYAMIARALRGMLKPVLWSLDLEAQHRREVAGWLTHMLTAQGSNERFLRLPLGTPTSVAAFNLVWASIDSALQGALCPQGGTLRYSRYVDDLCFSSDQPFSRDAIALAGQIVEGFGYQLNPRKSRLSTREEAIIHGLCWRAGALAIADKQVLAIAARIQEARARLHSGPAPNEREGIVEELARLQRFVERIYQGRPRPRGLQIEASLLERARPASPRWVEELWG